MFNNLRADAKQYSKFGGFRQIGFWIVAIYRFGSFAKKQFFLIRVPLMIIYFLLCRPVRIFYHVEIPASTQIGPGLYLPHPFNIMIDESAVIGQNCSIFHGVTIGNGPKAGLPIIGNNVVLFTGSCILGGITIGDKTEIGPLSVLTSSIKEKMIVISPQSRVLTQELVRRQE
jgi:serine O-acetyltransferase